MGAGIYIVRPDALEALDNPVLKRALSWYYGVLLEDYPAKFHIAKAVEVPRDERLSSMDVEGLWGLHRALAKEFDALWREVRRELVKFKDFKTRWGCGKGVSFLDVKIELAWKTLRACTFCAWRCGVDRSKEPGRVCRLGLDSYVHSWFLHIGEEAPLVPSGTIFYGSCNFRCVFCQNWDISQERPLDGVKVNPSQLALLQKELKLRGARNINHVGGEPTPNLHNILASLKQLDVNVAQLWNSNFYMSDDTMELLIHVIDIWLPDFKYGNDECAFRLSKVPRYLEVVGRNHKVAAEWGDMIIRHLVLPNHIECCSKKVLRWVAENLPKDRVLVNIMDQYRPEYKAYDYKEINRRPRRGELEEVYRYADELGILWREVSR